MTALADVQRTVTVELLARFPHADALLRRELEGTACLATVLEATRQAISEKGCGQELAATFATMRARLSYDLKCLGRAAAGTMAAGAYANANTMMRTMLAVMPPAGTA